MKTQNPRIPIIPAASHPAFPLSSRQPRAVVATRSEASTTARGGLSTAPHQPREYGPAQKHVATGHNADGDSYRISSQARAAASARSGPSTPGRAGTPPAWAQLLIFAAVGCAVAWIVASLLF